MATTQTFGPKLTGSTPGELPVVSGTTIATPATGKATIFLDSNNGNAKTIIDSTGAKVLVDSIITVQLTLAALNAAFVPAAVYTGKWAIVSAASPSDEDGIYQCNGSSWVKKIDDADFKVGTRTNLWDYVLGLGDWVNDSTNHSLDAGTITGGGDWTNGSNLAYTFDGNTNNSFSISTTGSYAQKMFNTGFILSYSQMRISTGNSVAISGYTVDGGWELLVPQWVSVSAGGGSIDINGYIVSGWVGPEDKWVTAYFDNNFKTYTGYRITLMSGSISIFKDLALFSRYRDLNTINCITSINKLNARSKDFSEWIDNGAGGSLYGYSVNAIVKHGGTLYKANGTVLADSLNPSVNTTDWSIAIDTSSITPADINTSTYTISDADAGKTLFITYDGNVTITVPTGLTKLMQITFVKSSAVTRTVNFTTSGGATLASKESLLSLVTQYGAATLLHKGSDAFYIFGDLE